MSRWPLPWRSWAAVLVVVVLAIASTAGLHSILGDWSFLLAATLGAVTAAGAFLIALRFALLPGETLAVAIGLFVVGGVLTVSVLAAGEIPTPSSFGDFFDGLIRSWADLLSAVSPADLTPRLAVAPFAIAWFGAIVGCALLRWSPLPGLPVVGPLAGLALTVLLTDEDRALSIAIGASIAVGALLLGFLVDPRRTALGDAGSIGAGSIASPIEDSMETTTSTAPHARTLRAVLVLVAVAVAAPLIGPRLPLAEANERYDLRDQIVPPWDPLSLPSPLVQLKSELAAEVEDEVMFEVTSDSPLTRWSTAAMTTYDGVVWTVADPDDAATDFRPVSPRLPPPDVQPASDPTVSATVTIDGLDGPWLPVPGAATRIEFEDAPGTDDGESPAPTLMENQQSNTVAVPTGVDEGTAYTVTALTPPEPSDDELRALPLDVESAGVDLDALPPQIRNLAADVTEGIDHGWGQVAAIRDLFRNEGFYDKTTRVPPGHSYYRLAQFLADPEQIVGYEEQYAAAAALISRIAELPVRVVTGYEIEPDRYVDGTAEVRSGDASAWIEVKVDGIGWVPVSVSPPRSREPDAETAVASEEQVATPNPPPPPQVPPDVDVFTENEELEEPVEDEEEEDEDEEEVAGGSGIGTLGRVAIGVGTSLLVVALACGTIIVWKQRRTRRRREAADPAARIAGAWLEMTDRYEEAGVTTPDLATPLETVRSMTMADASAAATEDQLVGLAREVDRAAYDRTSPPAEAADTAWRYSDEAVDALLANQSLPRRTRMRVDPRTLRHRDPLTRVRDHRPRTAARRTARGRS